MIPTRYGETEKQMRAGENLAARAAILVYGLGCYLLFVVTFAYMIAFVGNLALARSMDGQPRVPFARALLVDLGLIALFGLHHSLTARASFKRRWQRIVPPSMERSTYVLASSVLLLLLAWLWQPIAGLVWEAISPVGHLLVQAIFWCGWVIVLLASFAISHFDLFGLKQVYLQWRSESYPPSEFQTPLLYRAIRHPMMLGMIMAFWAAPHMTVGHLLFAASMTVYILIGIWFEERDLVTNFGDQYRDYRHQTPMLVPFGRRVDKHEGDR
jgi:methanethiol S-methyltransferase